ncbi:hypothetical protein AUTU_34750 [Aureibacter tunicatorum]|nr:hypothetical protein AUTU_34750 [Aureibacter tunicatorum]
MQEHNISENVIEPVILAVDEVCANVIIHSYGCNSRKKMDLNILFAKDNSSVTFEIHDASGCSFNIENYEAPSIDQLIREKRKGGLGLRIVKQIMDRIEFESQPKLSTYRLYKKIP